MSRHRDHNIEAVTFDACMRGTYNDVSFFPSHPDPDPRYAYDLSLYKNTFRRLLRFA